MFVWVLSVAAVSSGSPEVVSRRLALRQAGAGLLGASVPSVIGATTALLPASHAAFAADAPLALPSIGIGAWAWGDSLFWGYDKKNDDELQELFDYYAATPNAF